MGPYFIAIFTTSIFGTLGSIFEQPEPIGAYGQGIFWSSGQGGVCGEFYRMSFIPFATSSPTQSTWSPLISFDQLTYDALRLRYDDYLMNGINTKTVDQGYIRLLRILTIIATNRMKTGLKASDVWEILLCPNSPLAPVATELGILMDELFISISKPKPSEEWYVKLLAIRDAMYRHWINNPKSHTKLSSSILTMVCNATAILEGMS